MASRTSPREGTFYIGVYAKSDTLLGYSVTLEFCITQHIRDLALMQQFPAFFGCGYVALMANKTTCQYRIRNIKELELCLFPLLKEFPLKTQKALDAYAFQEALSDQLHSKAVHSERH